MTFNKELHPKRDVDRLYVSKMEGGRELIGCKMCVKAEESSLGWYVKHHIEPLIVAVRIRNTARSENSTQPKEFMQQDHEGRLNNWRVKAMCGQYVRQIEDKDKSNLCQWIRKSNRKECTEALTYSAQEQVLRTNYMKFHIEKTGESLLCYIERAEQKTRQYHILLVNVRC